MRRGPPLRNASEGKRRWEGSKEGHQLVAYQGNQRILALERMPGVFKDRRTSFRRRSFQHQLPLA
jgi:hypothetical protein